MLLILDLKGGKREVESKTSVHTWEIKMFAIVALSCSEDRAQ